MSAVEITLNEWLFNAVVAREILTLNRDYFRLDGGLERRLYELARKHCGRQAKWAVSVYLLHKKSGSQATLKKFRELLKRAAGNDALPDYHIRYDQETDRALFYAKDGAALALHLVAIGTSGTKSGGNSGL